jgi:lipopolysaccharide/colanic/teichoic acid biosynthesis glycosyltransferase/GGDEF domain-containing protein
MKTKKNVLANWLISNLRFFSTLQRKRDLSGVYSEKKFHAILKNMRDRADRSGQPFSLVTFEVGRVEINRKIHKHLLKYLSSRLRSTDEVGWFNEQQIGVILRNASTDSALKIAQLISTQVTSTTHPLESKVYTYPPDPRYYPYESRKDLSRRSKKNPMQRNNLDNRALLTVPSMGGTIALSSCSALNSINNSQKPAPELYSLFVSRMPVWKRCMDIVGSLFGLLVITPLFIFIPILIKIVSPGPVIFRQERMGHGLKPYKIMKFRTMHLDADCSTHKRYLAELINGTGETENSDKPMTKLEERSKIIPFGRILRKSCLDELPQLINVLRGEMSLVGPRPPIPYEVEEYLRWHKGRFNSVPGMTGLWQVSGKNRLSFREMVRLDIRYARQLSFWLDFKILLKTPIAVITEILDNFQRGKPKMEGATDNV